MIDNGVDFLISLTDFCNELSISVATGHNWIKLGKITPQYTKNKTPYFKASYLCEIQEAIKSGRNTSLKSRRNKKYITGNELYNSYVASDSRNTPLVTRLLTIIEKEQIILTPESIHFLVADCALHLFTGRLHMTPSSYDSLLSQYLNGSISLWGYDSLIDDLIEDKAMALQFANKHPALFSFNYTWEPENDILGLIYISCSNLGKRKATGSYYTPTFVVKKLISQLNICKYDRILDPCCGTGNFLLQLPTDTAFENVYGNDSDLTAVRISRINMALRFPDASVSDIQNHISRLNYLTEYGKTDFNFIIGNPPWGYNFTKEEKEVLKNTYTAFSGEKIESYDIFIEKSLLLLAPGGSIAFVLPEAILNVKAHTPIREIMLKSTCIQYLEYLGDIFNNVQCPSIILHLVRTDTAFSTRGMIVNYAGKRYEIETERKISPSGFNFLTSDAEYRLLEKIKNRPDNIYLMNNADFAMGIVTGSNKTFITDRKTQNNEPVLKGCDIFKYRIKPADNYITYRPELFQQTAPEQMYRAPEKLLYRFICNRLVFAYDNKQTLSLNSCNIVIPRIADLDMKYILAILNSSVAQFVFIKEFNSMKVLKSHIESIPIPLADKMLQDRLIHSAESLIGGLSSDAAMTIYEELDREIFDIFGLSPKEQMIIKNAVNTRNLFL